MFSMGLRGGRYEITRGSIFSHVRPFYEQAVSDLDRSMHRSLWVQVAHNSFIEGSHATKNTASENSGNKNVLLREAVYPLNLSKIDNCSFKQKFLLQNGIIKCNAFSVAPSMRDDNLKMHLSMTSILPKVKPTNLNLLLKAKSCQQMQT